MMTPAFVINALRRMLWHDGDGRNIQPFAFGYDDWNVLTSTHFSFSSDKLTHLPDNFICHSLSLNLCHNLEVLPPSMRDIDFIELEGCIKITELPTDLSPKLWASLRGCSNLKSLPKCFDPHSLNIVGCRKLLTLPALPHLTSLIVSKGDYKYDIAKLPITEVMMEDPKDNKSIITVPKDTYMLRHKRYATLAKPKSIDDFSVEVEPNLTLL